MVFMGISHLLCGELRGQSSLPFLWKEWQESPESVTGVTREFRTLGCHQVTGSGGRRLGIGSGGGFM